MVTIEEIQTYINEITEAQKKEWEKHGYTLPYPTFEIKSGSVYHKIIRITLGSKSLHCFVDMEGNIFKSASWNAPAKGIRGNIKDAKKPLLGYDYYKTKRFIV